MEKLKSLLGGHKHEDETHDDSTSTSKHHGAGHGASGYDNTSSSHATGTSTGGSTSGYGSTVGAQGTRRDDPVDSRVDYSQRETSGSGPGSSGITGITGGRSAASGQGASGYGTDSAADTPGYASTSSRTGTTGTAGIGSSAYPSSTSGGLDSHVPGTESYAARQATRDDYDPYSTERTDSASRAAGVPTTGGIGAGYGSQGALGTGHGSSSTGVAGTTSTVGNLQSYIPGTDAHAARQTETGGAGYGTSATGLSSGNTIRPTLTSGNTSTASIKSGIVGGLQDSTALSHDGTSGMSSSGTYGSGSGLTGSSLPDRSVGGSGATSGSGLHLTHGPHVTDTANRWDPRVSGGDSALTSAEPYTSTSSAGMVSGSRDPYATSGLTGSSSGYGQDATLGGGASTGLGAASAPSVGHHSSGVGYQGGNSSVFANDPTSASSTSRGADAEFSKTRAEARGVEDDLEGASRSHHHGSTTGTGDHGKADKSATDKLFGFLHKDNKQENKYEDETDTRTAKEKYYNVDGHMRRDDGISGTTRDPYDTTSSSGQHYGRDSATAGGVVGAAAGVAGVESSRHHGESSTGATAGSAHNRLTAGDPSYESGAQSHGVTGQGLTSGGQHFSSSGTGSSGLGSSGRDQYSSSGRDQYGSSNPSTFTQEGSGTRDPYDTTTSTGPGLRSGVLTSGAHHASSSNRDQYGSSGSGGQTSDSGKYGGGEHYQEYASGSGNKSVHDRLTAGDPSFEAGAQNHGVTGQGLTSGKQHFSSHGRPEEDSRIGTSSGSGNYGSTGSSSTHGHHGHHSGTTGRTGDVFANDPTSAGRSGAQTTQEAYGTAASGANRLHKHA